MDLFTSTGSGLVPGAGLTQDTAGVTGVFETGDRFGHALAKVPRAARRDGEGGRGIPLEDVGAVTDIGAVQVFPLNNLAGEVGFDQNSPAAVGSVHAGGRFGSPVVSLEAEHETALAIGDPFQGQGKVYVVCYGDNDYAPRAWTPATGGIPAGATRFGWSLAAD